MSDLTVTFILFWAVIFALSFHSWRTERRFKVMKKHLQRHERLLRDLTNKDDPQ